jgi:hypothetical protein
MVAYWCVLFSATAVRKSQFIIIVCCIDYFYNIIYYKKVDIEYLEENMQNDNSESKRLDIKIRNQGYVDFANIYSLLEKDIVTEGVNITDYEVELTMASEGDLILQSLQKVCGKLREAKNYNQEMIPIIEKIVDIAEKIYRLTEHEPPTIQET